MRNSLFVPGAGCVLAAVLGGPLSAQRSFVNFETPQVKPITVARVAGRDYLAVCNTPDNGVEIYDTSTLALVARYRTGLEPVTVVFDPTTSRLYTANFLGDSVTIAELAANHVNGPLRVKVLRTTFVGDEPTDLAFVPGQPWVLVTLQSRSSMAWLDKHTLAPIASRILLTDPVLGSPTATRALMEPRRILFAGGRLLVLGQKGGNSPAYDFDLLGYDAGTSPPTQTALGGLGSTNHAMTLAADGRLWVVGTLAQNQLVGEQAVAAAPTGFVQSRVWIVRGPGAPGATIDSRDLHRDPSGAVVPKSRAVSQPTDVALLEGDAGVAKAFVAGFHSDRIGVLHPNSGPAASWPMTYVTLANSNPAYARTGPRAFALKPANPNQPGDPGARLYVMNSLSNSVSVIDPFAETEVSRFALANDPTPANIRLGREFLYSADISRTGFVSCASCHVDGRTDSLAWDLGVPGGGSGPAIPKELLDGVQGTVPTTFPQNKGRMVTQTLQGLVTYYVDTPFTQYLFTTAPHHWRGDRANVAAFNGAFVTLLGAPNLGTPSDPKGLTPGQIAGLMDMIHTITYPPNPEQPLDRRYSGTFGTPGSQTDGSGALRGLKLFHITPIAATGNRSCVQCHFLPEGSNNRITLTNNLGGTGSQPIESAAMRMLFSRESRLELNVTSLSPIVTGEFGLLHTGGSTSINGFIAAFFSGVFNASQLSDVIAFTRQMDSGVAPMIGQCWTVTLANKASSATATAFRLHEAEARKANAGLAVHSRLGGVVKGYWFDVTHNPPAYREEGTSAWLTGPQLLARVTSADDLLVLQSTPLGSERRVAAVSGTPAILTGPAPSNLTLAPMVPGPAWTDVPSMTRNWPKGTGPDDFRWIGGNTEPISLKAIRIYQQALIAQAPGFGLTVQRHEAPRRFRVAGDGIRPGARLVLLLPGTTTQPPPYSQPNQVQTLAMPIFPTDRVDAQGRRIWETAVEAEPLVTYALMLGGAFAPGVAAAYKGQVAEPPPAGTFDPIRWNKHFVQVRNEDGTFANGGWLPIRVQ